MRDCGIGRDGKRAAARILCPGYLEESRFQLNAVGPTTSTGHRAQGIAQFMPYTAAQRGLLDPFDPKTAPPEAAEFLAELRSEFGNLGLAAAAYNAGPGRVRDFIDKRGSMPAQTRNYVRAITGRSVDEWVVLGRDGGKDRDRQADLVSPACDVVEGAAEFRHRQTRAEGARSSLTSSADF